MVQGTRNPIYSTCPKCGRIGRQERSSYKRKDGSKVVRFRYAHDKKSFIKNDGNLSKYKQRSICDLGTTQTTEEVMREFEDDYINIANDPAYYMIQDLRALLMKYRKHSDLSTIRVGQFKQYVGDIIKKYDAYTKKRSPSKNSAVEIRNVEKMMSYEYKPEDLGVKDPEADFLVQTPKTK